LLRHVEGRCANGDRYGLVGVEGLDQAAVTIQRVKRVAHMCGASAFMDHSCLADLRFALM
jgi:hypothetical protein